MADQQTLYVVDTAHNVVLYSGNETDCLQVLKQNHGGLTVIGYWELTPKMIQSLPHLTHPNT